MKQKPKIKCELIDLFYLKLFHMNAWGNSNIEIVRSHEAHFKIQTILTILSVVFLLPYMFPAKERPLLEKVCWQTL